MASTVRMVWAQAAGGVIGADGGLPWHLPEDLRLFKALTHGSTVVMGRRTWESLPPRVRPLPGRRNVVLSSTMEDTDPGAEVARSVDDVLALGEDLWVIGGGGVYAAFLPHADEVVLTEVDAQLPGDTWAPALGPDWALGARLPAAGWAGSAGGLSFRVSQWRRSGTGADPVAAVLAEQASGWTDGGRSGGGRSDGVGGGR
ncbi:dihydrofolate reductase [uncultured Modestobacter sp.]|uniref:dihydrofolate reductase n=1 Tax=uncultured Modestobacter sp. TaxID=380048 RepID=UPI00261741F2|nr:dihydrofolate reductase [uncultured Modestobacter sp.]